MMQRFKNNHSHMKNFRCKFEHGEDFFYDKQKKKGGRQVDISKFDYEIDEEIKETVPAHEPKTIINRFDEEWDDYEDGKIIPGKKKAKKKTPVYYEDDTRPPKPETYYIVYNNVEFVILAKKIGWLDEFKQMVLENHGEFYNYEDEFFDSRDAERVVERLKQKFSDREWFIQTLAASIEQMFDESTLFDDLTFDLIQKRFFMLRTETLYEAITFLANK